MVQLRHDSRWDAFISHATEDKDAIARPLAERLRELGLRVWFDEFSLTVGDSLRRSIDKGLAESRFGIVIVSPAFLNKHWTQQELDGLTSREVDGRKVILPVWHNIDASKIRQQSPILADRLAVSTKAGIEKVVSELLRAIRGDKGVSQPDTITDRTPKQVRSASREPDSVEFSVRFAQSFPGVRDIKWFESETEIQRRLSILLAEPLDYPAIWWWRDGNNQIKSFKHQGGKSFLMDVYELDIRRIAAVHNPSYYRQFIYVELNPMEPTGLYPFTLDRIASVRNASSDWSYFWEEYGLVDASKMVTREEYDDGAAIINGKLEDIRGRVQLRVRYVTPYNFLIAPQDSPINNQNFDQALEDMLDKILRGEDIFQHLCKEISKLPKQRM